MSYDLNTLRVWIRACLIIAAICTTAFPVLYSFSPWFRSELGRALMVQAIAFALVLDFSVLFQYWQADIAVRFWINALLFTLIAVASTWLTLMLWKINHQRSQINKLKKELLRHGK